MRIESPHGQAKAGDWRHQWLGQLAPFRSLRIVLKAVFETDRTRQIHFCTNLGWRTLLLEWAFVFGAVLSYCSNFLNLGTQRLLVGNEVEMYQYLDEVLVTSLSSYGQFPLWNPYLRAGQPFIAEPFLHLYNPLATVPALLLGTMDGFKVGLALSFVAAGLGAWWLGAVLGVGRPTRLWMALMYAFTGQAAAKFLQGHYLFVLGFPWIPWAIASLMAATRTRRPLHCVMAAVSIALVYFSGNGYYAYYMLFVIPLFALTVLFNPRIRGVVPGLGFALDRAKILMVIGGLAFGLVAIEAFPTFEFMPYVSKGINAEMNDSHSIVQAALDYLCANPWRPDALKPWHRPEEWYAYTGIWPFLAMLLLPLVPWKRVRRQALFLALLFLFVLLWVDVKDMPWRYIYVSNHWFNQFRYPTRMLIFGAVALVGLGGLGVDALWQRVIQWGKGRSKDATNSVSWVVRAVALGALVGFMIGSAADLYKFNKPLTGTRDPYLDIFNAMKWLRGYDPTEYFVSYPGDSEYSAAANHQRYLDPHYGFNDIRVKNGMVNRQPVEARAKYIIGGNDKPNSEAVAVQRFQEHTIYSLPHSLPFAFVVKNDVLLDTSTGRELQAEDVTALTPFIPGPNGVEIITQGDANSSLVVLTTLYPGWEVTVDGRRQKLKNVGGYLATDVQAGVHRYVFSFSSPPFAAGLLVSLMALVVAFGMVVFDVWPDWREALAFLRRRRWLRLRWEGPAIPRGRPAAAAAMGHAAPLRPEAKGVTMEAVYAKGVLKPALPLSFPENSKMQVAVVGEAGALEVWLPGHASRGTSRWLWQLSTCWGWLSTALTLEWVLFALAALVYAATRLWALDSFPIYFFTDEAAGPLWAEQLLSRGLRDAQGSFLPVYFEQAPQRWMPLLSVYFHLPTMLLFGKSILVTRATSAVISMLGSLAIGLILKWVFKARYWWVGVLLMAATPAWFLHSRTAFETVMMVSFYACFLLCYLLYRTRSPRYLYVAFLFGGLAFYCYSNGQAAVGTLGILLLVSDFRYHLRQWRTVLRALAPGVLILLPLAGYVLHGPAGMAEHLSVIGSYVTESIPVQEKLARFLQLYSYALSPQYWFSPQTSDIVRHLMAGYGFLRTETLPFLLAGVALCLWRVRSSTHRAVLFAALASPVGAALAGIGITRVLAFVVPAALFAGLGLEWLIDRFARRVPYTLMASAVFAVLSLASLGMLRQSLTEGPLWFRDYALYGMQYGAKQLFQEVIPEYLKSDPNVRMIVSPTWANGTDKFVRFFLTPSQQGRVQMGTVAGFMTNKGNLNANMVLVMTPAEYNAAKGSPFFKSVQVEITVPYPDGSPGFYFARLTYADNVDALMAADRDRRRQLVEGQVQIGGQPVWVRYSQLDMGEIRNVFDGDRRSLARGAEANPFVVELQFPQPRAVQGLALDVNNMDFSVTVSLHAPGTDNPVSYDATSSHNAAHEDIEFQGAPQLVSSMRVEIKNLHGGEIDHIHVYELALH